MSGDNATRTTADLSETPNATSETAPMERAQPYAYYALVLLTAANFFNYLDRQSVSIIANDLKGELGLSDSQLGFLLGTAFAVLYGVFGVAMGRIADVISRTRLMATGLAMWSGMTVLSGKAFNFASFAATRVGVGIGEAVANPCSHSLLSEYFPARNRSTVLGIYLVGSFLGIGASLALGGLVLQEWGSICSIIAEQACAVPRWRAVFFVVGIPGLPFAILLARLKEPPRTRPSQSRSMLRTIAGELSAAIPPFTLFNLNQVGGWPAVRRNLLMAGVVFVVAVAFVLATGDLAQWVAVGIGVYSVTSWGQALSIRDRPMYSLTYGSPLFIRITASISLIACFVSAVQAWAAPYAMRTLDASAGQVGLLLGTASALSSGLSVVLGGLINDRWKRVDVRAPLWLGTVALAMPVPALLVMLNTRDLVIYVAAYFLWNFFAMGYPGAYAALIQDIILPRMRATASAAFSLIAILFSASMGPYWAGKISTVTGSLRTGLYAVLVVVPVGLVVTYAAAVRLSRESPENRHERARMAGERI